MHPVSHNVIKTHLCVRSIAKVRKQSLLEICIHTPVAFGVYEMVKYQGYKRFGIKNCLYCKNFVDSYDAQENYAACINI